MHSVLGRISVCEQFSSYQLQGTMVLGWLDFVNYYAKCVLLDVEYVYSCA